MGVIIYSVLISFLFSILQGPLFIPILHKLKFGQPIREDGPKNHMKKAGTPTMGGIIFITTAIIAMIIMRKNLNSNAVFAFVCFFSFAMIGLIDDSLKILHKKNEGLTSKQKFLLQIIVSAAISYYAYIRFGSDTFIPFLKITWTLPPIVYMAAVVFYFVAVTNAVNLTDGLDGLASSVTILVVTFFTVVSFSWHQYELSVFCGIIVGILLGFLKYNSYPAQIFMGDTGSIGLGGAVAAIALVLKLPLLVIIVGGIYVIEVLSDIIQVSYFKLTGKRVFKMAPIHHHFEKLGWHETKVVSVFSIVTVILCLIAFLSLI
ncbi:phospho-N-acetylmuramoyl-pentapeptide-transferase [Clostridium acetobutylicum]|uniref:Phospho-N-acetylmuramoyl-pentapeptide-transferase n=1 Tax=Clostridium acetobutylicum (strain ATCC 824 / DSM 792 / JCM 1419 / IAM 19013 / LMG 5710 / NBRC 13948 / NRRL B-527 / VKM B-1787 / 2291 / W) TaxID=272562 RepID=MRAY_CLOAB|nr:MULTISPECIES: phospho-N-acetylmuramoyl-pentapeptide-transferase [Clostridium]Q97H86.1 RecName: Full=Phospho-N-acetylmuramoyl-pentapeptide-transferase; AltName: Full=UDP-MurNAc-pentapeptide phosphotransferase [Clostridium acetobutylicum ATCC 824]AAK80085.1 Phospho-N-acetylmuramoyl-pentapeptide transferase, MraY [Clostridium acetobutylicum ATCC 824]ADZ21178.1 phospho-N-acetylmuramoyl-pentapeptide-transferase [Clostridium acetobutylicum EA 2018]AEI33696.1 phospho-N-acetylmuramoyl-pentapeptide-t